MLSSSILLDDGEVTLLAFYDLGFRLFELYLLDRAIPLLPFPSGCRFCVCFRRLGLDLSRFLSFLCRCHNWSDANDVRRNNGISAHVPSP